MKNSVINDAKQLMSSPLGLATDKNHKSPVRWLAASLSVLCLGLGFAGAASATDVYLKAQSYDKTIAGVTDTVPMWGFVRCDSDFATNCGEPGAQIDFDKTADTSGLTVHLMNTLPAPVSFMIPGQPRPADAMIQTFTDTMGRTRVRSMTTEVASGDTRTYTWTSAALKPGTFLYQSGTNPSIQVPMGLYGAFVVKDSGAPYTGITATTSEMTILLSEVDPLQNRRVALSTTTTPTEKCEPMAVYNTTPQGGYPCTIDYNPTVFLVNGASSVTMPALAQGEKALVRFLNAGLRTHTSGLGASELQLIAEDGNLSPGVTDTHAYRTQATAMLPAGKTIDAWVVAPSKDVTLSLYDHMSSFTNLASNTPNGGALANVDVGTGTPPVTATIYAVDDTYTDVIEDTPYTGASVLTNDMGLTNPTAALVTPPVNGTLVLDATGTFTYTPKTNFSGTDSFVYNAVDNGGTGLTYSAVVTLNVSFENDAPVAKDDTYTNIGTTIKMDPASGVLGNDSDADGDSLTATLVTGPDSGTLELLPDGSFTYTGTPGTVNFSYFASDASGEASAEVQVTLTLTPGVNVALTVQEFGTNAPIDSYRWIVQEDKTYHLDLVDPQATPVLEQQALNLHKSTMPVIAQGCVNCTTETQLSDIALDPTKYYYVSVLPNDAVAFDPATGNRLAGHTIGGAQILPDTSSVTVIVNPQEIPTAQIAIEVFQDTAPTNGAIDGGEAGLGGFTITLEDGGGRYGIAAGIMFQDTYGNPLINSIPCFGPDSNQPYLDAVSVAGMPANASLIETCPDTPQNVAAGLVGHVLVKNLAPGKYGVIAVPPGSEKTWVQTSTIEGTKIIDVWVKAGEPPYFNEFGLVGPHAFIGFTRPETTCMKADTDPYGPGNPDPNNTCQVKTDPGTSTITGHVTALHDPKPPLPMLSVDTGSLDILNATRIWVGLNSDAGIGPSIATIAADENGNFSIPNVPNGDYQVVVWDKYLDVIIAYFSVTVLDGDVDMTAGGTINQGVPEWFTRSEHNVFLDDGCGADPSDPRYGNGIRDLCDDGVTLEEGMQEQAVNIRWRDGTVFQSFPTDSTGFVPFDEVFPFFSWQLYEIDYLRFKPTGVTVTEDKAGPLAHGNTIMEPKPQETALFTADNEGCSDYTYADGTVLPCGSRTETGPVLLEAFQSMPGQTHMFDWGKVPYQPGENGGIAGIVFYSSTRAEWDPRLTIGEPWEPGIAKVKVRLYSVVNREDGSEALSLLKEVQTDSWDATPPEGCQGETDNTDPFITETLGAGAGFSNTDPAANAARSRCFDGFRNYNQVRPGVFDGGYAFMTIPNPADPTGEEIPIPPGKYVVEVIPPTGYEQYKEEDVNVSMGDARTGDTNGVAPVTVTLPNGSLVLILPDQAMVQASFKEPGLLQPPCVGQDHVVPDELSLFPGEAAPFAGATRQLCNRKLVVLSDQSQAAADFHLFTMTPVAAQFTGLITDDISMETNPASPMMGEKFAPPYMPFTIRDYNGTVVYSGLGDAFGRYNGLLPSTFSANIPMPSGYSPAMMQACLNDAGTTVNPRYFAACNTGQFMPGTNTYLDTPILPQAAFAGGHNPPDCAAPNSTPVIASVTDSTGAGPLVAPGGSLTITSMGTAVSVPNPDYQGPLAAAPYNAPNITRNFGFGGQGSVTLNGQELTVAAGDWSDNTITATVPAGFADGAYQLVVTNGAGVSTSQSVSVTVADPNANGYVPPIRVPGDQPTIQDAIDAAAPSDLILVAAGTYNERVIMSKPIRLQGVGPATVIDALQTGAADLENWRAKLAEVLPSVELLPGLTTISEEGAGITVLGTSSCAGRVKYCYNQNSSRIDGFTITNAANGGALLVHANANGLEISNNTITANSGQFNGGIRVGQPLLPNVGQSANAAGVIQFNADVNIHHNAVTLNGALNVESAGGGISINTGSQDYIVANNFICGNYTAGDGAGIGHLGVSHNGTIKSNKILFNQAYNVGFTTNGGGIMIAGEPAQGIPLTLGTGSVVVDSNLIQSNNAGSGHGGGIRLQYVNGNELVNGTPWKIDIVNNMVVNNVAAWSGGGISMLDAVNTYIVNNTVSSNDTTATEGSLVVGNNSSSSQPAGIVAQMNSAQLHDAVVTKADPNFNADFSNPRWLRNNIIWHNRVFHLGANATNTAIVLLPELTQAAVGDCDTNANYWDLGVLGQPQVSPTLKLDVQNSILTSTTDYAGQGNIAGDPVFLADYCNGARTLSAPGPIQVFLGTGEGGNFVDVRFGPLVNNGNYHIDTGSAALDAGIYNPANVPIVDIDGDARPQGDGVDIGADEML